MGLRFAKWDLYLRYLKLNAQVQTLIRIQKYISQAKTQTSQQLGNQVLSIGLGKGFQLTEILLRRLACSLYKPQGDLHIIMGLLAGNFEKNPLRVPKTLFWGCGLKLFSPLSGTNSITVTHYM